MCKVRHYCFCLGFFVFLLAGCQSTGIVEPAVLDHQRQLDAYQGAVDSFIRRADECAGELERIRERAGRRADEHTEEINHVRGRADILTREIDKVIRLFDDYQQAVERLLQEYNRLRDEIENINKGDGDAFGGAACAYPPENSRLYPVLQGDKTSAVARHTALRGVN